MFMKKVNLTLFSLIGLLVFISCSSDEDYEKEYSSKISKVYRGDNLTLTLNSEALSSGRVLFVTKDLQQAQVTLIKTIPGEDSIVFSGLNLEKTYMNTDAYAFSGTSVNADRMVAITGVLVDGTTMNVNVTHTITSPVANEWTMADITSIRFKIKHPNPNAVINMHGLLEVNEILLANHEESFESSIPTLLSLFIMMLGPTFDLDANGNFGLAWTGSNELIIIPPGQVPDRYLRYNIKDGQLYLAVALDSILGGMSGSLTDLIGGMNIANIDIKKILELVQNIHTGVPLNYELTQKTTGSGSSQAIVHTLSLTVTKEMMLPYIVPIAELLPPLLAGIDWESINNSLEGIPIGLSNESIAGFLGEFIKIMYECEQFDIIFSMTRETPAGV